MVELVERHPKQISDLAIEAARLVDWLESDIGIKASNTRIGEYRECVGKLSDLLSLNDYDTVNQDIPKYHGALLEIHDLLALRKSFPVPGNIQGLVALLKQCISGTIDRHDSTDVNSSARDYFFEALLGSRIFSKDLSVSFPDSSEYQPDIRALYKSQNINIQCKRLNSAKTTEKRLRKAMSQLETNWVHDSSAYGVIAVEVSKAINPDTQIWNTENQKTAHANFTQMFNEYIDENIRKLIHAELFADSRLLGIILHSSQLYYDRSVSARCYLPAVMCIPFYESNSQEGSVLDKILYNIFDSG